MFERFGFLPLGPAIALSLFLWFGIGWLVWWVAM